MATNLKKLRESLNLSQIEFAKSLGLNKTTYNNYESGIRDPKSDFWEKVARTYSVTVDYLLGITNDPHPKVAILLEAHEQEHIKKYRALDEHGKRMVNLVMDEEAARITREIKAPALEVYAAAIGKGSDTARENAAIVDDLADKQQ